MPVRRSLNGPSGPLPGGVSVQAEELPTIKDEDRVVEAADGLVLVEHGLGPEQVAVPADAPVEIGHGDRNVCEGRKRGHRGAPRCRTSILSSLWMQGSVCAYRHGRALTDR